MYSSRAPKIPDYLDEAGLASRLSSRLAGSAVDGKSRVSDQRAVIWVDGGDEVLVHLSSIRTQIGDGTLLVSIDLETDQTGRTPMIAAFALGSANDPAGLIAVADELPRGDGVIASRWGKALQEALWASLLGIAVDHARERLSAPLGLSASSGRLQLRAGEPPSVAPSPSI
jgi:hypothetical protein